MAKQLTKVVNLKHAKYDVLIDRTTKWGNPFSHIGSCMSRRECVNAYEVWLKQQPELMAALPELKGKILGCHCRPDACHGDVLVRLANELE